MQSSHNNTEVGEMEKLTVKQSRNQDAVGKQVTVPNEGIARKTELVDRAETHGVSVHTCLPRPGAARLDSAH